MKRRPIVAYWQGFAAGRGDVLFDDISRPVTMTGAAAKSKKQRAEKDASIRVEPWEPLIWEEKLGND